MDHFCLIELAQAKINYDIDADALAMFGKNPETWENVDLVIERFDTLLPEEFNKKRFGGNYPKATPMQFLCNATLDLIPL